MKLTDFLRLKKPESTDYVQIEDLNANMDVLDAKARELSDKSADTITAGTFAGQVVANSAGQTSSTSLLRNSKLVSTETNPTVNGEIYWTYE